jgi:hypothetical protein
MLLHASKALTVCVTRAFKQCAHACTFTHTHTHTPQQCVHERDLRRVCAQHGTAIAQLTREVCVYVFFSYLCVCVFESVSVWVCAACWQCLGLRAVCHR